MKTSNALPAETLPFEQIVSHQSLQRHKRSPGAFDKEYMMAIYNLRLFQTAFQPHPPTSNIQTETLQK